MRESSLAWRNFLNNFRRETEIVAKAKWRLKQEEERTWAVLKCWGKEPSENGELTIDASGVARMSNVNAGFY